MVVSTFAAALDRVVRELNLAVSPQQQDSCASFYELLLRWNAKINLTSVTGPEDVARRHFLESFLFALAAPAAGHAVDIGSGAGFPGLVVKIMRPALAVTLLEPRQKRAAFLKEAGRRLSLKVDVRTMDLRQWLKESPSFDVAMLRGLRLPLRLVQQLWRALPEKGLLLYLAGYDEIERFAALGRPQLVGVPGAEGRVLARFQKCVPRET